jgi:hypothetical protein
MTKLFLCPVAADMWIWETIHVRFLHDVSIHHASIKPSYALSETKWSDKNMGAPDRIPSNPAISRHDRQAELVGGAFRNTPLLLDP